MALVWILLWALSLFVVAALVFMAVYVLVSLSDLQGDAINPIDMCNQLNNLVLPEVLINLPLVLWHAYSIKERKHRYDATQIFRVVDQVRRVNFVKLGFYMLFFFFLLYRLISTIIYTVTDDDESPRRPYRGRKVSSNY